MQIQEVFAIYKSDLQEVQKHLDKYLTSEVKLIPEVGHHLIDSGGKRLRPLLLLICARLCGYCGAQRFSMAAIIEFIHNATLLHDDVVDQATIRRGNTSANNIWGNAASVLVGDFLYCKSFMLLAEMENLAILKMMSSITADMSEGEVFQLMKCGNINLTEEEYFTIIKKKTAALISAACACGAILASASAEKIAALKQFGFKIGMAFQITDDTLDYMAKQQEFGKTIGKDLEEGKMTLPLIYALRNIPPEQREEIKELIMRKDDNDNIIANVRDLIDKSKGIDYSLQIAEKNIRDAQALLNVFSTECQEIEHLNTVVEYILARRH